MITASRIELAERCLGAFTLPHLNERNEWSDGGTERHAEDEGAINRGEVPSVLAETWPGFEWRAEVALAYDVATGEGREIGQGIGRAYGKLNTFERAGTADAIGCRDGHLVVVDKKSFEEVTRAATNPQLRFLGLAATRAYKPRTTEVATTHLLRGLDRATLNEFDLDETHHRFRQLLLDVSKARADAARGLPIQFNTGRHCRWCPAFMDPNGIACPKQRELTALVKSESLTLQVENQIPFNDDDSAADAYDLSKRLGILLKRLNSALYARANERVIPLRSGKLFGPKETKRLEIDGDVAYEVIRELHGQAIADAAVSRETSQTSIENALKFVAPHGELAGEKRRVLDVIKERGGTSHKTSTKPIEYEQPQRLLKAVP